MSEKADILKRLIDILGSCAGLIILAPVIAAGIAAVRLSSPGPGIFSQTRVGRHGVPFRCHKLRTMHSGTPNVPTHEATASYVTSVGRILRRTKIDELPQLYNVLRGEMSLVGPRPCLPSQIELVRLRREHGITNIRPGITGLAQIRGIDMSNPARLCEADAEYLASASTMLDLRILLGTVFSGAGQGDKVQP